MSRGVFIFACLLLVCFDAFRAVTVPSSARNRKLRQLSAGITRCNNHNLDNDANKVLLDRNLKHSEFVFTGKVVSEFDVHPEFTNLNAVYAEHKSKGEYRGFVVRVKRVMKGDLPGVGHGDHHVQVLIARGGEAEGDKYSHVCYSVIRINHTAIFLARRSAYRDAATRAIALEVATDPLAITLRNLDQVHAFVKDMTYKPRPPLQEEPCEKKYCPWGSLCVVDGESAAHCECPSEHDCAADPTVRVCGTDGVTYESQCRLRRKACVHQDNTRVRHSGECGSRPRKHRRP